MDINNILRGVECDCGKTHRCDIEHVYVEREAISRLTKLCEDKENILIVADENTYSAAGEKVEKALNTKVVKKVIFSGKTLLIPNEAAIERIRKDLDGADLILGIGSGVIQDLCKYVSFFEKVPYMIVATAPSMDGYASSGAAMILKGMKETVAVGLPKAIIADVDILRQAPIEMIKAGFGDIIGKYSALCDWKLSQAVNGEYFCRYIYDTTYKMIENTLDMAHGLLERNEESVKALMEALIIVGIMMSFAGSSRPASGSEHHLSHFFEIVGIVNNEPYFVHGIDVAYSTVITAEIRERLLKSEFPNAVYRPSRTDYIKKMEQIYKSVGDGVEFHPSGCITFPLLGTKAKPEDKLAFDPDRAKRRRIYDEVVRAFSEYSVFVGGSSSFDMAPTPYNKYYALDVYCSENNLKHEDVVYIGDDYGLGGNDEAVYKSDFAYLTIDDYRDFPEIVKPLL